MTTSEHSTRRVPLYFIFPFITLLSICVLSVFQTVYGLIIILAVISIFIALLKPEIAFFLILAVLPLEGFALFTNVSYVKPIAFLLALGLALRFAITEERVPRDDIYKYFILFFLGSFISLFFARELTVSAMRLTTYLSLFLLYFFGRYFMRSFDKIYVAIDVLLFSTLSTQLLGVAVHKGASRISGGFGDANGYAAFLLVLLPLTFFRALSSRGFRRVLYWSSFPALLVMIIWTGSRGGFLGFVGIIVVLTSYYASRRLKTVAFSLIIVIGAVFYVGSTAFWERVDQITVSEGEDTSIDIRLQHYKSAVRIFFDHPFAGVGINNFQFVNHDYGDPSPTVVHDMYLEVLTGGGLFAFIPFCMILANSWKKVRINKFQGGYINDLKICLKASFVAYLITALFLSSDQDKTLWLLISLMSSSHYLSLLDAPATGNTENVRSELRRAFVGRASR